MMKTEKTVEVLFKPKVNMSVLGSYELWKCENIGCDLITIKYDQNILRQFVHKSDKDNVYKEDTLMPYPQRTICFKAEDHTHSFAKFKGMHLYLPQYILSHFITHNLSHYIASATPPLKGAQALEEEKGQNNLPKQEQEQELEQEYNINLDIDEQVVCPCDCFNEDVKSKLRGCIPIRVKALKYVSFILSAIWFVVACLTFILAGFGVAIKGASLINVAIWMTLIQALFEPGIAFIQSIIITYSLKSLRMKKLQRKVMQTHVVRDESSSIRNKPM